jgi:KDO2-lipid IV(A) lauroyltransferase
MIKFILQFFAIIPLRLNHLIGSLIGRYLYLTNSKSRQMISKNIELCFAELTNAEQQKLIKKNLIETGKNLTESGFIWFNSFKNNAKYITKTTGIEYLKTDEACILLTPHFGCWEITGRVLSLFRPITFLYKPLQKLSQEKLLFSKRQQGDLLMASADKKGVIKLQRAINKKQLIGILPDQDPGKEGGMLTPFFGINANTMTLLARLARKNNTKVLLTWAKRLPYGKGFEMNIRPINILADSGLLKDDLILMNKAIEKLIKTQPEQYLWNYKRFKSVVNYTPTSPIK